MCGNAPHGIKSGYSVPNSDLAFPKWKYAVHKSVCTKVFKKALVFFYCWAVFCLAKRTSLCAKGNHGFKELFAKYDKKTEGDFL